jgi:hypothetical protein
MTRRAVEQLNEAPEVKPDTGLASYDDGVQIFYVGMSPLYVDINTGLFWRPMRKLAALASRSAIGITSDGR